VEPPAGIEPATPSLPFVWSPPIEEAAQVTVTRVTVSDRQAPPAPALYGTQMARRQVGLNLILMLAGSNPSHLNSILERLFASLWRWGPGTTRDLGRPIAAPLERCAELLGVDLTTIRELAATVEPYVRADGTRIWSLMQLERQLRPEAYGRRRGGYVDRRQTPAAEA
jgi:hypothetical protein